jgi:putative nucleotidyltransferase with HDIG domain
MTNLTVRDTLLQKATDLKIIPTLNGIINKVFHILGNKNSSFNDLCDVVQYDQAISSKIISIANSAYYSRGVEIFHLQRAMLTIGFEEIKGIVTALLFMDNILKKLKLKEEDLFSLWKHSIQVACAAKILSERMLVEDPPKAYTVSLLHDIGKIVFYLGVENYGALLRDAEVNRQDASVIEKQMFGIDHQEAGYIISVKWKFPEDFAYAIRHHHEKGHTDKYASLINIVKAADQFFLSPENVHTTEGLILQKEKDRITREMEKIINFLQLV